MLTKYGVPTSTAWILSSQGSLISRDLSKKVNINLQSASSLRSFIQQLLLKFLVIVGTSASYKPRWLWKPLLGSCYDLPLCLWKKYIELIGCLRHHDCYVIWQRTPWMLDTSQSMEIVTSNCLLINNPLSRDIPFRRKMIATRLSISS